MRPTRKVAAGGLGGAIAVVLIAIAEAFGLKVDGELGSALTVIATFALAYFVPELDTATPVGAAEPYQTSPASAGGNSPVVPPAESSSP